MSDTTFLISGGFFDAVDSDRLYSADQMNQPYKKLIHDGINREADGTTPGFAVTAGGGMNVLVATGNAMIGGKWAENKAVQTIAVAGNTSGSARIDSIILQCDKSRAVRAVQIVYRQGTTAAPDLVSDDDITELRLANIRVPSTVSSIASENITDTRGGAECPWVRSVFDAPDARYIVEEYTGSELAGAYQTVKSAVDSIRYAAQSGQPTVALQASDMIDSNLVYLYQGSETGYSTGYLYYYSDAAGAWIRGAQYGASVVDTALDEDSENPVQNKAIAVAIKTVRSFVVEVPGSAAAFSGSIAAGDFAKALATYTAGSGVYAVKDGEVYQLSAASSSTMTFTQMYHGTMNFIKQIQITSADTFTVTNTALSSSAADTSYNNTTSGLTATDVQAAIDENAAAVTNVNGRLREQGVTVSAIEGKVPVVDAVAENYTEVKPDNWHNTETDTEGILKADGTTVESTTRFHTDYIAVVPGDVVRAYHSTNHNKVYFFNITYYDSAKTVMPSAGSNTSGSYDITVPEGAAYIRLTLSLTSQAETIITINLVPTNWSIQYFDPYYTLSDDMLTAGTKSEIDRLIESGGATLEPVKGYNLLPLAENGIGACYASGTNVVRNESYNTYHWAVIPVTEGKRYYINRSPEWWILADDNDTVKASGRYFSPASKRYVDVVTGATRLYVTFSQSTWVQAETYGLQFTIIVAEGINGTSGTHLAPAFVTGLTQRMRKSTYACALPKAALRCTVGIEQKWYQKNMFSVDGDYASIFASAADAAYNYKWRSFTPNSTGEKSNGFYYMVYDDQMALVDQLSAITEYFYTDNVADASALVIGDSTVDAGRMTQTMLDMWTERGKTLTLLGTRGTAPNLHEGRSGASAKGYCTSTTTGGASNPFYNSTENKFDFSQYMSAQGYASVDFVIIQLGTNDIFNASMGKVEDVITESMGYICQIIDSILAFNPSQKILINLPVAVNPNASTFDMKFKHNIFVRFNAAMMIELTKYNTANVRVSYNHLRLDPETDINDHVHPTQAGYAKMGVEVFSQINAWQKG